MGRRNTKLTQRRNIRLPLELMAMIFDFYVHIYAQPPEKLLPICRTWYSWAISQPKLWTNLDPFALLGKGFIHNWAGSFFQSRIARSNPAPLRVNLTGCSWDLMSIAASDVTAIPTFLPRIQELVIASRPDAGFLVGDQPLLKTLTIN